MLIGLAQIDVRAGDREANLGAVRRWAGEHLTPEREGAAVVLPELWDTGYALADAARLADAEGSAIFLGNIARERRVRFVGGSVLAMTDRGAANRALAIDERGEIASSYDKAHLFPLMDEDRYLSAGAAPCVFDIGGVRGAMIICYDIRFPEWARICALRGADVIFVSAQWPAARADHWSALLRARAIENGVFIAACNRSGESGGTEFAGRSAIFGPWGETLAELGPEPGAAFAEIDPAEAARARERLRIFKARRPELYGEIAISL